MHPDALIAGLQRELETCTEPERMKAIREEIKHADAQDRPTIVTEAAVIEPADFQRSYLAGLRQELEGAAKERAKDIKTEITRVEKTLKAKIEPEIDEEENVSDTPSAEEIEQRRQARTDQGVEQARNAPLPGQPVPAVNAPGQGAEENSTDE